MSSHAGLRITRALQHRNFRLFFGGQSIPLSALDHARGHELARSTG
jgi:hypothetical protein